MPSERPTHPREINLDPVIGRKQDAKVCAANATQHRLDRLPGKRINRIRPSQMALAPETLTTMTKDQ